MEKKFEISITADFILGLGRKVDDLEYKIKILEQMNELLIKHINKLDNRSRKFSDKFRFGKNKFTLLKDDLRDKKHYISQKEYFNLNDD